MISSFTMSKSATKQGGDRHPVPTDGAAKGLTDYYAALLRLVQAQQTELGLASYAVGLTSCSRGEGVTTIAINLAITAAYGGQRKVLLVDANPRHAAVAELLDLERFTGMTEVLSGTAMLGDSINSTSVKSLSVLPAGSPGKQLGSDFELADVVDLLDELKSEFGLIVFDLPQAEELSECYAFAQVLDGTFLVIEAGRVDARIARRVTQRLAHCDAPLLGAIYNNKT